ncbi:putative vitamin uptake transporter [Vibrio phage 2.275.O._10N.286.54.E11]|nr:putative vitamin uptake transporter [Vibrio phage 2.275.O._10N.286.54.E11]
MFNLEYNIKTLSCFSLFHIFIIALSNYAVQFPINLFGFHSTLGAFTFPFIFLATDLTVRVYGAQAARKIITIGMLPALVVSYIVSIVFFNGDYQGLQGLYEFNTFVFRIALASFAAYTIGQVLDIVVFNKLRDLKTWWVAPACSNVFGAAIDTIVFFSIAFYMSSDAFMAANWVEIGIVDYFIKIAVALLMFLPLYGVLLTAISKRIHK